jgi:hypothetical protein
VVSATKNSSVLLVGLLTHIWTSTLTFVFAGSVPRLNPNPECTRLGASLTFTVRAVALVRVDVSTVLGVGIAMDWLLPPPGSKVPRVAAPCCSVSVRSAAGAGISQYQKFVLFDDCS